MIYQFKITLQRVEPVVWRRIQVPEDYSFWDLHVAIQDAMGWLDRHPHEFTIANPETGEPAFIGIIDDWSVGLQVALPGWKVAMEDYFGLDNREALYTYDFGDDWKHRIRLEAIEAADPDLAYPWCVAGAQACPPEDVGGIWGYEEFLRVINDPADSQHAYMLEWVGGSFEPDEFDPKEVEFDDPQERFFTSAGYRYSPRPI